MHKRALLAIGLCFASVGTTVAAPAADCVNLDGTIQIQPTTCQAFQDRVRREQFFQDTEFPFAPGTCFVGTLDGILTKVGGAGKPVVVRGATLSALTAGRIDNPMASGLLSVNGGPFLMAATIIDVEAVSAPGQKGRELGSLFLRDTAILVPTQAPPPQPPVLAYEQLIAVGGSKEFTRATASFEVFGPEFYPHHGQVRGTICH